MRRHLRVAIKKTYERNNLPENSPQTTRSYGPIQSTREKKKTNKKGDLLLLDEKKTEQGTENSTPKWQPSGCLFHREVFFVLTFVASVT